jgi:hypothetical protein
VVYYGLLTWNNFGLVFVFDKGQLANAGSRLAGVGVETEEWRVLWGILWFAPKSFFRDV